MSRGKKVRPVFYEWLVVSMAMMFNVLISLVFLPVAFGLHWFVCGRDARGGWDSPMGSAPMEGSGRCQEWLENRER